jgi:hypothetical protein
VLPKGSTYIAVDDLLFVLTPKGKIDEVSRILNEPRKELSERDQRENEIESRR